jgi:hypothetical protein
VISGGCPGIDSDDRIGIDSDDCDRADSDDVDGVHGDDCLDEVTIARLGTEKVEQGVFTAHESIPEQRVNLFRDNWASHCPDEVM